MLGLVGVGLVEVGLGDVGLVDVELGIGGIGSCVADADAAACSSGSITLVCPIAMRSCSAKLLLAAEALLALNLKGRRILT
jgi:hypothetical protein